MGKAAEKVNGSTATTSAAPVMRYRRKVPTTKKGPLPAVAVAEQPVAVEANEQAEDNQMEHRDAEIVVGEADNAKSNALPHTLKQKPLKPGGATRKKKPKANAHAKEASAEKSKAASAAVATPLSQAIDVTAHAAVVPKKKLKKRQLNTNFNANDAAETATDAPPPQEYVNEDTEPVQLKPTKPSSHRKHKNDVNSGKHKGPSLLKQLLWKAKSSSPPVSSQAALSVDAAAQKASSPPPAFPPVAVVTQQKHKHVKPKQSPRPSVEDQAEQEEVAYTVSERHLRKLQASKNANQSHSIATDSCSSTAVVPTAMSSQETQSGSDDDEAATAFMSAFENLVPSAAITPMDLSTAVRMNVFYPTPFPLALTTDAELLKKQGLRVHEVLIENFSFHPAQLRVQPGDVVVWKMSGETLGMVEHSLEASLMVRNPKQKKPTFVKATTPPLGGGGSFAWRFETPARIHIECSVYKTKGVVLVGNPNAKKDKKEMKSPDTEKTVPTAAALDESVDTAPLPLKEKQSKRKAKAAARKRAATEARAAAALAEGDHDCRRDSMDSDVAVFHPPHNAACSAEIDAGVCREVLTQLEEVVAAVQAAATNFIVIGDVQCPVVAEVSNQDEAETNTADRVSAHVDSIDKPSALGGEWSGTEEDDDDDDRNALCHTEENEIEDFQQRIIGMLKRSEEARAQHRRSFQQEESGFDAGAAYDFFKQRFMRVQEERQIVYAVCPEQQRGSGVGVTDVVSLLLSDASV